MDNHPSSSSSIIKTPFEQDQSSDGLIKGTRLKFPDTKWTDAEGIALNPDTTYLCMGTTTALQRWIRDGDKSHPEVILKKPGEFLPDVDDLNSKVPKSKWEKDLTGKPRPPWAVVYVVYAVDPVTGKMFTAINSTVGMRIAFRNLNDQVLTMQALRGANVAPIIKLSSKPMKTQFGMKTRPEFEVVEFRSLGGALPSKPVKQITSAPIGDAVEPPSTEEIFDDEIPHMG